MKGFEKTAFAIFVLGMSSLALAQDFLSFPHNRTSPSIVPNGCLQALPLLLEPPDDQLLIDGQVTAIDDFDQELVYQVKIWRYGCHEPNRSAIMINLDTGTTTSSVTHGAKPALTMIEPDGEETALAATLWNFDFATILESFLGFFGFDNSAFPNGLTYIVDGTDLAKISAYNSDFTLRLGFLGQTVTAEIPSYEPLLDSPQFPASFFHGRYSGQWVVEDLPSSGLVLQIGEIPGQDRNFIFAIWFTYIDGSPLWVVGTTDLPLGSQEVDIEMLLLEGGGFITEPGSFTADDVNVQSVGTMTLRANHCNEIEADIDFSPSGLGTSNLSFSRLIRIAGYDCDETQ